MSETTMVNFRMDSELKKSMESVCREMGLSMTTAFTMFATKVSRERRIPFEVNADPFYSAKNMAYLSRVTAEIDSGAASLAEHELIEG
ncbi:MAG: type II toxin-antitoxin system RelB/DinJ family antitoxin [Clostridia bacterium]|nr:type II toxin-antitoxin system RelB/DinJ family antitoxin [Clostridia bacterium]